MGIYITALGDNKTPPECECHIRSRAVEVADDRARYNKLLDMESSIPAEERFIELNEIIESRAIPWLEDFSDDRKIIAWISGEKSNGLPILKSVFEHYGLPEKTKKQNKPEMATPRNPSD